MAALPQQELLSTLAEMGIGIVGFAMVADILRHRSSEDTVQLYTLRDVAEIGLMCAVLSALPLVVHGFGVSADSTWRLSSGVAVVWSIGALTASARRSGAMLFVIKRHWFAAALIFPLVGINMALVLTNLLSPGSLSGARHVAFSLVALTQAGAMFILSVFHLRDETPAA